MRQSVTATVLASSTCLALAVSGACERNPDAEPTAQTPQAGATAEVQEIKDSPGQFYGRTLTLSGEVEQLHGDRAFVLEGDGSLFQDELLVVTRSPVAFGTHRLRKDDDVLARGKIQPLVVAEIERELGWDLSPELETEFRDKPVMVAESIRSIEETARWTEAEQPQGVVVSVTAIDIIGPEDLVGQTIALDAVPVQAKTGKGLWVGYQHRNMLLVAPPTGTDLASIETGDIVAVQGQIQKMPGADEALQRWNIDAALRSQVEREVLYVEATKVTKLDRAAQRGQAAQAGRASVELGQFARGPEQHIGNEVQGEAMVTKVFSDRGFWLRTDDGAMVLAVVREDVPRPEMIDIDEGQRIRLTGDALSASQLDQVAGTLEQETKEAIRAQGTFISTHWRDISILEKAAADPRQHRPG